MITNPGKNVTSGGYTGNDTVNRVIPHGLGKVPKLVLITNYNNAIEFQIWPPIAKIEYQRVSIPTSGNHAVTVPDAVNFYVGNATSYLYSANSTAHAFRWVAIG